MKSPGSFYAAPCPAEQVGTRVVASIVENRQARRLHSHDPGREECPEETGCQTGHQSDEASREGPDRREMASQMG